ncbi:paraquat-inducible protein B [Enhydrobacter aerosaccus]|uniref:Paraquat-inducible protein B n=1 Tax=Enhydrobacter aerosaccus TaxID=225324 RepID=A0A1T4SSB8_9HYPH|nr:MlaD family protein [Enhydrobacter aerosaccus]SKA31063.1 paraquat-inducible protein B [Enhydrobacter aerosaccus]
MTSVPELPTAVRQKGRRIPLVWIVPLLTALIGGWLAWDTFSKRGPTITITFESAQGLQAGQSQLKFKDVQMGTVKSITVADDLTHVIVTVETTHEAKRLLTDKTTFWVVKPQLFAGRVSGIDTLLSGSYIGMLPSTQPGEAKRDFIGANNPPILEANEPGTTFHLDTKNVGSISLGSPVFYRNLEVGTVLGWDLKDMARHVTIHAFVRAPFDQYVHDDSLFWDASGISVKLGADGVRVEMESVKALLLGGVAFDTSPDTHGASAKPDTTFELYASKDSAMAAGYGRHLQLLSYFEGSVGGLDVGADVTLHGLKIGEVTDVGLKFDPQLGRIVAPVHYKVESTRIANTSPFMLQVPPGIMAAEMVRRGFRATLQSANLLTGKKLIAIEMIPGAPPAELKQDGEVFIVPSTTIGGFESLTRGAGELIAKVNSIDFTQIGASLVSAGKGLDNTINGPELKQTLASLAVTMKDMQSFMGKLDSKAGPALDKLPDMATQLDESLRRINALVGSLNQAYGGDSRFSRELDRVMPQLNEALRSIRALSDLLARHPEALIKGRTNTGKE